MKPKAENKFVFFFAGLGLLGIILFVYGIFYLFDSIGDVKISEYAEEVKLVNSDNTYLIQLEPWREGSEVFHLIDVDGKEPKYIAHSDKLYTKSNSGYNFTDLNSRDLAIPLRTHEPGKPQVQIFWFKPATDELFRYQEFDPDDVNHTWLTYTNQYLGYSVKFPDRNLTWADLWHENKGDKSGQLSELQARKNSDEFYVGFSAPSPFIVYVTVTRVRGIYQNKVEKLNLDNVEIYNKPEKINLGNLNFMVYRTNSGYSDEGFSATYIAESDGVYYLFRTSSDLGKNIIKTFTKV